MKIYTKTGDKGKTSLFGGERVWKNDKRIEAYGTVDELNAVLGVAVSNIENSEIVQTLQKIQNDLFIVSSDLAAPIGERDIKVTVPRVGVNLIQLLEEKIDYFDSKLPELKQFILPGGTKGSSLLHFARTVCRRAERKVVELSNTVDIVDYIVIYLNRLSDLLFVLARFENSVSGTPDIKWTK